jgi:lambda family phage portal protein
MPLPFGLKASPPTGRKAIRSLWSAAGRSYDSAKTTRVNEKHWTAATLGDADATILAQLGTLRNRVRFEMRNNGYAEGMVETYATDVVGPDGPAVQIESDDEKWNEEAEAFLRDYFTYCDHSGIDHFADLLRLAVRQRWECGESFAQRVTAPSGGAVRTRYLMIEPDRIATPNDRVTAKNVRGGIKVTNNGRPVEYFVMKSHPGDTIRVPLFDEFDTVPARDMIHVFRRFRPGQTRGVPRLAPVLDEFAQLRDWDHDTLLAARMAAMLAAFIHTDHPEAGFDDIGDELPIFDIEPGTLSTLPRGWNVSQVKPEHPSTQYRDFKREKLAGVGRVANMPYLKVAADASGHNYSSARLDDQGYWDEVKVEQAFQTRRFVNPVIIPALQEAALSGEIRPAPVRFRLAYIWNERPHVDPSKETRAQTERLGNGTTTLARECKAAGGDWQETINQRMKEIHFILEAAIKLGIDPVVALKAFGIEGPVPSLNPKNDDDKLDEKIDEKLEEKEKA